MNGVTVKGAKSLDRKLANLAKQTDGETLKRALVAGGLPIQNKAKANAPYKTGNLRRSLHIGGETDVEGDVIQRNSERVPVPEVGANTASVYVGTDVEYGAAQEFGRSDVNLPAQPYLRPAFDTEKGAAKQEVADALRDLIRAAAK